MGKRELMRDRLKTLSDEAYKEFNDRILNAPSMPTLGIRIPKLRELAKEAAKEPEGGWLDEMLRDHGSCVYQEEHMLFGMASGYRKASREEHAAMLDIWVPGVLSWADCDCSTSTYKWMEKDPEFWFSYLEKWLNSSREFELRFGVIALMDHFLNDRYIDEVLRRYADIRSEDYYVRMGIAWGVATAYVKYPEKVLGLLKEKKLDIWTHNKAIQKCRESRRVSAQNKEMLNALKRKQEEEHGNTRI
ncbi:DNA alkylation repair protein [Sellimonas sp.]|uniref:DNA alkylation repair protein n=1 Tax=Sellimonas sp. TaxID=2021466 RepID=UPI00174D1CF3|nr:DNA alkylation repair protein [Sellimonas sp.]